MLRAESSVPRFFPDARGIRAAGRSRRLHYFSTAASSLAPNAIVIERILRHFEEPRRSDRNKRGDFPAASTAFAHPNTNLDTIHTNRLALHMEVLCEPTSTSMTT